MSTIPERKKTTGHEYLDEIADEIVKISTAIKAIEKTRVKRSVIEILLRERSGMSLGQVRLILDSIADLERIYLKANP